VKKGLEHFVRKMVVEDSPYLPRGEYAFFAICEDGVVDVL
jgi:hypothetical protein